MLHTILLEPTHIRVTLRFNRFHGEGPSIADRRDILKNESD